MPKPTPTTDRPGDRVLRNVEIWGRRTSMRLEQIYFDALSTVARERGTHPNMIATEASDLAKHGGSTTTSAVRVHVASSIGEAPRKPDEFRGLVNRSRRNLFVDQRRICVCLEDFFWEGVTDVARDNEMSLDATIEHLSKTVGGATSRASAVRIAVLQRRLALAYPDAAAA